MTRAWDHWSHIQNFTCLPTVINTASIIFLTVITVFHMQCVQCFKDLVHESWRQFIFSMMKNQPRCFRTSSLTSDRHPLAFWSDWLSLEKSIGRFITLGSVGEMIELATFISGRRLFCWFWSSRCSFIVSISFNLFFINEQYGIRHALSAHRLAW